MEQWSFAVFADTHRGLDTWATRFAQVRDFIIAHKNEWNIKVVFISGDVFMSDVTEEIALEVKNQYLDPLGVDYYFCLGNHDRPPSIVYNTFGVHCPSKYFLITTNNHKFILIGQGYGFHSTPDEAEDEQNFFNQSLTKDFFNVSLFHASLEDWEQDIWGNPATDPWFYPIPNADIFKSFIETLGERHLHFHGHYHGDQWISPKLPLGLTIGVGIGQQTYPHFYQRGVESVWRSHTFPDPNEADGLRRKPWIFICRVTGTKIQIDEYNAATEEVYLSQILDYYGDREPCVVKQMKNDLPDWTEEWNSQTRTFQAVFEGLPDGLPVYYGESAKPNRIEGGELVGYDDAVARIKPYSLTVTCKRVSA